MSSSSGETLFSIEMVRCNHGACWYLLVVPDIIPLKPSAFPYGVLERSGGTKFCLIGKNGQSDERGSCDFFFLLDSELRTDK